MKYYLVAEGLAVPKPPLWGKDNDPTEWWSTNDFKILSACYRIYPPDSPSFNIYCLASAVVPFKEFFHAGLHPVHCGLPCTYFGSTKWSGCCMMGDIICAIQWVWL